MGTNLGTTLTSGSTMNPGDYLKSADGTHTLVMRLDGNLVLGTTGQTSGPWLWQSNTLSTGATCTMMLNGDLVITSSDGVRLKHSATSGNTGAVLKLDTDAHIRIETIDGSGGVTVIWDDGAMYTFTPARLAAADPLQATMVQLQSQLQAIQTTLASLAPALQAYGRFPAQNGQTGASSYV